MKNFWILKLLDKFEKIFNRLGINYRIMRSILQLKLTLDNRKVPSILAGGSKSDKEPSSLQGMLMYALTGVFAVFFIFIPMPMFARMSMIFSIILFMVTAALIADFSSILLDVKDKTILLSKPIDHRTVNCAKILHIVINLLPITYTVAIIPLAAGLYVHGILFFLLMMLELLLMTGFILFITSFLYFFVLAFFDGDKLKDIINNFQIILSLLLTFGYQFSGRIFKVVGQKLVVEFHWWTYLLPSSWFAAPFTLALEKDKSTVYLLLSIASFLIPVLLTFIYFKFVMKYFENNLHKLDQASVRKKRFKEKASWTKQKILSLVCPNPLENALCRFTLNMAGSERNLKLRLYPNLAIAVLFPFLIIFNTFMDASSFQEGLDIIANSDYIYFLYIAFTTLSMSAFFIIPSEKYQGAWIYRVLPIDRPEVIAKAGLKGYILKFAIPVYLFAAVMFLIPYGLKAIPDLLLAFINMLLLFALIYRFTPKELPFSRSITSKQEDRFLLLLGVFAFCAIAAFFHFISKSIPYGVPAYMLLAAALTLYFWKSGKKLTWEELSARDI